MIEVPRSTLVDMAQRVRTILSAADDLKLGGVAIHLDSALIALSACEGTGAIVPQPHVLA